MVRDSWAVCGEEGVIGVPEDWRFDKPHKDILNGNVSLFPEDNVEWSGECGEGGVITQKSQITQNTYGSGLNVKGEWLMTLMAMKSNSTI